MNGISILFRSKGQGLQSGWKAAGPPVPADPAGKCRSDSGCDSVCVPEYSDEYQDVWLRHYNYRQTADRPAMFQYSGKKHFFHCPAASGNGLQDERKIVWRGWNTMSDRYNLK